MSRESIIKYIKQQIKAEDQELSDVYDYHCADPDNLELRLALERHRGKVEALNHVCSRIIWKCDLI